VFKIIFSKFLSIIKDIPIQLVAGSITNSVVILALLSHFHMGEMSQKGQKEGQLVFIMKLGLIFLAP
jgi:hypothetical protein